MKSYENSNVTDKMREQTEEECSVARDREREK